MTIYSHRNGETDAPTEVGWYWFEGGASVRDWEFLHSFEHGPTVYGPFVHYLGMTVFRMLDEYLVQPQNAKGKWYGPIVPPQESE